MIQVISLKSKYCQCDLLSNEPILMNLYLLSNEPVLNLYES